MRHDLRNPLNAIKGYAELVLEELDEHGGAALRADLEACSANPRACLARIDVIVDFSRGADGAELAGQDQGALASMVANLVRTVKPIEARDGAAAGDRPDPGGRRQRQQPRPAVSPPVARRPSGDPRRIGPARARDPRGRGVRPGPARSDDARSERLPGARAAQGGRAPARRPGDHDLGPAGDRQRDPLHRGGRRGLPAQAVQPGPAARPDQRLPGAQALARARAPLSGADRAGAREVRGPAAQHPARPDRHAG